MATGLTKKARHYVWLALSQALSLDELRGVVRSRLKARRDLPGGQLHGLYGAPIPTEPIP